MAQEPQGTAAQMSGSEDIAVGGAGGTAAAPAADGGIARAHADYEAAFKERAARITELEAGIVEVTKTAEGAQMRRWHRMRIALISVHRSTHCRCIVP